MCGCICECLWKTIVILSFYLAWYCDRLESHGDDLECEYVVGGECVLSAGRAGG